MQGIFQKENTDKARKYGIYRHLPTYEKIIRNLVSFYYKNKQITFIENAGGMIITKSIYEGTSKLKWFFREESVNPSDNGWRAIGDNDTQEYLNNPENSIVVDFNTLANIEPAVLAVYDMPVGTDLEFCLDNTGRYFIDTNTGKRI